MKKIFLTTVLMISILTSCNQKNKETEVQTTENSTSANELFSCSMHPEVTGKKGDQCPKCGMELNVPVMKKENIESQKDTTSAEVLKEEQTVSQTEIKAFSSSEIIANYLKIKNALVKDDANGAAIAAKSLYKIFNTTDSSSMNGKLKKEFVDIADDAKEHAEHIGNNASKIEHQREHFIMLSKDINDFVASFGSKQKLYQDFCPMANEGKGAIWISEIKEIKNPFFGSQMLTCGNIKKTF
ncbi:DUF3347 domain-containing protein [Flavobacterium sp.]